MSKLNDVISYLALVTTRDNFESAQSGCAFALGRLKSDFVLEGNQVDAKLVWCYETILEIQQLYLKAFAYLKASQFYLAWCSLAQCENALLALKAHWHSNEDKFSIYFIEQQVQQFQVLFPYRQFTSAELVHNEIFCSVCGSKVTPRNLCDHEPGEIYNGEMCSRVPKDSRIVGASIVLEPAMKSLVFGIGFDEKTGERIDPFHYDILEFVTRQLESPFTKWQVRQTMKEHPHSRFSHLGRNDKCPCGSGKKYKSCCLKVPTVKIPHFAVSNETASNDRGICVIEQAAEPFGTRRMKGVSK